MLASALKVDSFQITDPDGRSRTYFSTWSKRGEEGTRIPTRQLYELRQAREKAVELRRRDLAANLTACGHPRDGRHHFLESDGKRGAQSCREQGPARVTCAARGLLHMLILRIPTAQAPLAPKRLRVCRTMGGQWVGRGPVVVGGGGTRVVVSIPYTTYMAYNAHVCMCGCTWVALAQGAIAV